MNQVLVTVPNTEYPICGNYDCQNRLTEYETNKPTYLKTRWRFCANCRKHWWNIKRLRCVDCGMSYPVVNYRSSHRQRCPNCRLAHYRQYQKIRCRRHYGFIITNKKCRKCGDEIDRINKDARKREFCSEECCRLWWNERRRK